jgi:DNA mismatch endonuclease (patch repair protein)
MVLRRLLHAMGFRYRLYVKGLPGKPDLVVPKYRAVVFVHGCFWHRHPGCRYTTNPATRPEFWQAKFAGTVERDQRAIERLSEDGWRVAVVWECALNQRQDAEVAERLAEWLKGTEPFIEIPELPPETMPAKTSR